MRDAHALTIYTNDTLLFVEYKRAIELTARDFSLIMATKFVL